MLNNSLLNAHILALGIWLLSQEHTVENASRWVATMARFIFYLLTIRGFQEFLRHNNSGESATAIKTVWEQNKLSCLLWLVTGAVTLCVQGRHRVEEFLLLSMGYILHQHLFKEQSSRPTINYGTGMACSFFQGYLKLVIPGDGTKQQDSFVEKIRKWEDKEGVVFPVKKLLIVVTSSLYCPPDLREFNKPDKRHLPQIEACEPLEEVQKDVAGVKNRSYKNSAYKIYWPDNSHPPVYVAAECATPIHTLFGVVHDHTLYRELVNVDTSELVEDFCAQVERIVRRSPECRGKIEIVRFDDSEDSGQYLPRVLADKVAELEPSYMDIIQQHADLNQDEGVPLELPLGILNPANLHNPN